MADQIFLSNLRSVLVSEKGGIEISQLNKEYHDLVGTNLSYDREIYPTLESYLLTLKDICTIKRNGNQTIVLPVITEKHEKLSELIENQKSVKKKLHTCGNTRYKIYPKRPELVYNYSSTKYGLECTKGQNEKYFLNNQKSTYYSKSRSNQNTIDKENHIEQSFNKIYNLRKQNVNLNAKVIESKETDYARKEFSIDRSSNKYTPKKGDRSAYKVTETNLNIEIKDDEQVDYKYELSLYTRANNLSEPKYVLSNYVEKGKLIAYFSKVQIGDQSWLIYPDCCYRTAYGADSGVAKKALNDLKEQRKIKESSSTNQDDITDKLMNFYSIEKDPLFSTHIENMFLTKYNIKLEENWLDVIKESKKFDIETINVGSKVLTLVVPRVEKKLNDNLEPQEGSLEVLEKKIDKLNLKEYEIQELPESLELSKDEDWHVMVLRATNSREIVLRLTSNTNKLDELITDLQHYYNEEKLGKQAENVVINKIYAAVFDDAVFRVQPILLEGKEVYCWFLDDGITEKISKSNLYEIHRKFMKLPFQAFTVQLDGLKTQSESLIRKFIDDKMKENDDTLCLVARPTSFKEQITIRLYDTSNNDKDIDLNELIIQYINSSILPGSSNSIPKALLPKLNEEDNEYDILKVKISFVLNPHNFIITDIKNFDQNSEYQLLYKQLQSFYSKSDEYVELNESMIYPGLFVCVKDTNQQWYRARVDNLANNGECTCFLVDEGRIILVEINNVQPLYSQFLELPMIAIRACLSSIVPLNQDWNIDDIIMFKNLVDGKEFEAIVQDIVTIDSEIIMQLNELNNSNGESVSNILVNSQKAKLF